MTAFGLKDKQQDEEIKFIVKRKTINDRQK